MPPFLKLKFTYCDQTGCYFGSWSYLVSLFILLLHQINLESSFVKDALTLEPLRSLMTYLVYRSEIQRWFTGSDGRLCYAGLLSI